MLSDRSVGRSQGRPTRQARLLRTGCSDRAARGVTSSGGCTPRQPRQPDFPVEPLSPRSSPRPLRPCVTAPGSDLTSRHPPFTHRPRPSLRALVPAAAFARDIPQLAFCMTHVLGSPQAGAPQRTFLTTPLPLFTASLRTALLPCCLSLTSHG